MARSGGSSLSRGVKMDFATLFKEFTRRKREIVKFILVLVAWYRACIQQYIATIIAILTSR